MRKVRQLGEESLLLVGDSYDGAYGPTIILIASSSPLALGCRTFAASFLMAV
jgi:hypothetical protein